MQQESKRPRSDSTARIFLIGDSGVGKTCLVTRFTDDFFPTQISSTIGIDSKNKKVLLDGVEMKFQIWDTVGTGKYQQLAQTFYKHALGIIIVFDLTNRVTFENVKQWHKVIENETKENVCKLLIGSKSDMKEERKVSQEEINELIRELELEYFEVSAMTGENVSEAFMHVIKEIKAKFYRANGETLEKTKQNRLLLYKVEDESSASGKCW